MTAQKGRDVLLKYNSTGTTFVAVGGARQITMTVANEMVDITNADSAGIKTLLEGAGVNGTTLKLQGVYVDDAAIAAIRTDAMTNAHRNYQIVIPGDTVTTLQGEFGLSNFEMDAAYNGAVTDTLTLESSGPVSTVGE